MINNLVKTSFRTLIKHKSLTLISLFSLVVGATSFMLLTLNARFELSYDSFFAHGDRVYHLGQYLPDWEFGGSNHFAETSGIVAPTLKEEFPEVEYAVRVRELESPLIAGRKSMLGKGLYADRDFLRVFTFPMEAGDRDTALGEPFSVVLTQSMARKLFGGQDPLGRTVIYQRGRTLKVTGVVRDIPGNTHLKFDYLVSFLSMYALRDDIDTSWGILNYHSYLQLRAGASARDFESKLPAIVAKYHGPRDKNRRYFLTPLRDIHFETRVESLSSSAIDKKSVTLLLAIASLILLVCCVNHVNLSTARADVRGKEVGIRKTIGATRRQLAVQFLVESFILALAALLISLAAAALALPAFGRIVGNEIPLSFLLDGRGVAGLGALFLAVGFLAGGYPALYLSTLKPLNVLKGSRGPRPASGQWRFRNGLTVFQIGVTVVLVVGAVVVNRQLAFIRHRDIGYDRKNVIAVRTWNDESRQNHQAIKNELLKNPLIQAAAVANTEPLAFTEVNDIQVQGDQGEMVTLPMVTTYFIDDDYLSVLGMRMAAGRNFSLALSADLDTQVIINETAARRAGLKDAVGRKVVKWGQDMRIIGVVKDFHFSSLKTRIEPLMFSYRPQRSNLFLIKVTGRQLPQALGHIDAAFRRFSPNFAFDHAFLDDLYNGIYRKESDWGRIITGFSLLVLVIAAIGLYGLMSFVVARKTKEIAVRKVLGASVFSVAGVVLRKFLLLIAAAALISLPLAFHLSRAWLREFVYRMNLDAGPFVLALAIVLLAALASIGRQVLRAAALNPADTLRRE